MRTAREKLLDNVMEPDEIVLINDEALNESLVGVSSDMRAIYDYEKMAEELAEHYGYELVDARDYIDYNIIGSLSTMGRRAPIIMDTLL